MRVIFLPRWYPHRYDPMPGLFVQRQAEAVSSHCEVAVLYVHEDPQSVSTYEIVNAEENGIHVIRVYYRSFSSGFGLINKIVGIFRFLKANWLGLTAFRDFDTDLIHVHVLTRTGLIALFYKMLSGKPYVITEHWSRYFTQNPDYRGFLRRQVTGYVVRRASAVIAVSEKLKSAMLAQNLRNPVFRVIANPVDMQKFKIIEKSADQVKPKKQIIHISCFEDRSKNISGFLKVLKKLSVDCNDFECSMIGDGPDWEQLKILARDLDLEGKYVIFKGLKTQGELVSEINRADFMVLSSHFETFGTVVIESLACGIPLVATDVGVVSDVIDKRNGIIVPPGDPDALEVGMRRMLEICRGYDRLEIRSSVKDQFSDGSVGEQLFELYKEIAVEK